MNLSQYLPKTVFKKWFPFAGIFLIGLVAGLAIGRYPDSEEEETPQGAELREGGYRFINPLLECEVAKDAIAERELRPFKHKIVALVDQALQSKKIEYISIYFRDLNNGPWFGINEKENFTPASLLKVPVMIAYLKLAETNPGLLSKKITYKGGEDYNNYEYFRPAQAIEPGRAYTNEELISRMIIYSDNNAKNILVDNLNPVFLAKVYLDLGVRIPGRKDTEDFMSVKAYASFFRILFNASYLNREMSEKALTYLSDIDFKGGIVSGLPQNVAVAHKFGEHAINSGRELKQLHDCGIIYYPNSPYLLCVMTRGHDFESLSDVMQEVSRLAYMEIDFQHKPGLTLLPPAGDH